MEVRNSIALLIRNYILAVEVWDKEIDEEVFLDVEAMDKTLDKDVFLDIDAKDKELDEDIFLSVEARDSQWWTRVGRQEEWREEVETATVKGRVHRSLPPPWLPAASLRPDPPPCSLAGRPGPPPLSFSGAAHCVSARPAAGRTLQEGAGACFGHMDSPGGGAPCMSGWGRQVRASAMKRTRLAGSTHATRNPCASLPLCATAEIQGNRNATPTRNQSVYELP